jgi:hypothetical protein
MVCFLLRVRVYQTLARSSPPRFCFLAEPPDMTPFGGGDDGDAEAGHDAWHFVGADVVAAAGSGDALEVGEDRAAVDELRLEP